MEPRVAVVIDDDPDVLDVVRTVLENDGFRVVGCLDGPSGVRAVEEHHPVVITCDIHMPGMDGYAVVKRIRTFDDGYVIMISSLSDEIDIVSALEAGADDYLTKPFSPRELRARVHSMLRRHQAITGPQADLTTPGQPVLPPPAGQPTWLRHNGLELHPGTGTTLLHDVPIPLAPVEFGLLAMLTAKAGETCPAAELMAGLAVERPGLEQAMVGLHQRLGPGWIVVVPGIGLRMRA